ncbi:MAG: sigma-70 family RNA polymerase sigma factor [Chthoniobacter sp.]|uniref:sigma-70 family RNA polymerase sigma factor n=1 Tax=Chthoniobacter sp. TaxID=2510640 RepID=UPI0032A8DDC5
MSSAPRIPAGPPADSAFHPTRWTLVLRASGAGVEAQAALSDLCAAYYAPVVAFLRREGRDEDAAREAAHAFFAGLLAGGVGAPEPERGRFRSYLLGALKHHLGRQRAASVAGKRGGGAEHVPLATETDTSPGLPQPAALDDTLAFDREWAFTLIARALAALEAEYTEKASTFTTLKPWLDGGANCSQAEAAQVLGLSGTAVKVTIHRLRVRFRELIRAEIAATVNDSTDVADELRHLIAIASSDLG